MRNEYEQSEFFGKDLIRRNRDILIFKYIKRNPSGIWPYAILKLLKERYGYALCSATLCRWLRYWEKIGFVNSAKDSRGRVVYTPTEKAIAFYDNYEVIVDLVDETCLRVEAPKPKFRIFKGVKPELRYGVLKALAVDGKPKRAKEVIDSCKDTKPIHVRVTLTNLKKDRLIGRDEEGNYSLTKEGTEFIEEYKKKYGPE